MNRMEPTTAAHRPLERERWGGNPVNHVHPVKSGRAAVSGGDERWYNWDAGWTVISEEDDNAGAGNLTMTYVGGLADVAGSSPATGSYRYYLRDHLG